MGFNSGFTGLKFLKNSGGAANTPTYDAVDITIEDSETSFTLGLTNSGETPASIELSFSSDTGTDSLLVGSDFDHGTDRSPSYVIDPDEGSRTITLTRGSLVPSDPSSIEEITLTSNSGDLPQKISVTVKPLSSIDMVARSAFGNSTPNIEYVFNNNLENSGDLGSSFDLTYSQDLTVATSNDYFWAVGSARMNNTWARANTVGTVSSTYWAATQDRTWIIIWKNDGTLDNNKYLVQYSNSGNNNGPGYILTATALKSSQPSTNFDAAGTAYPSGTPTALARTDGDLNALCCSYNHDANTVTYMYKSSAQSTGQHTYKEITDSTNPGIANTNFYGVGRGYASSATNAKFYYNAIFDRQTTNAEFQTLLNTIGL